MRSQVCPQDANTPKKEPRRALRWEHTYFMTRLCTKSFPIFTQDSFPRLTKPWKYSTRMLSPSPSFSLGSQSRGQITSGSPRFIHRFVNKPSYREKKISVSLWSCFRGPRSGSGCSCWNLCKLIQPDHAVP